jgi:hypothetical protein
MMEGRGTEKGKSGKAAIPNLNEKMAWTEHLKAATLAPAGLRSRGDESPPAFR